MRSPSAADAIAAAAKRLAPLLAHLEKLDPAVLAPLAPALASLAADAEERLRCRGRVSFEDLLTRAAALLAEHPRVAADLRRGIDQLLVDEFQDTDARQCAIVASLALEGAAAERPGLFLVGDPEAVDLRLAQRGPRGLRADARARARRGRDASARCASTTARCPRSCARSSAWWRR